MAAFDPAISRIAAQQLTNRLDIGFIATAHVCRPCASAPGRIRKTLYAKQYDRFFALQHKIHGFQAAAKLRAGTGRQVPDLLGNAPTTRFPG
jgi:hypothetical protein